MSAVVSPVLQRYVPPPATVNVVLTPLQMVVTPVMFGVGIGLTVTAWLAVAVHPETLVTVTVYVISADGLTVMNGSKEPLLHLYRPPPVAVSVVLPPLQITEGPVIATTGFWFTMTVLVAVAVHPLPFVTVTV
jgi:hypothetical protein